MAFGIRALLAFIALVLVWFVWQWVSIEGRRGSSEVSPGAPSDITIGFVTNFLDALGIGNFAPTTAAFKLLKRIPDEEIPGTLNVGHTLPVLVEAFIFIAAVAVDFTTLLGMLLASVVGAWFGAGVVSRLPRRGVQIGMGVALSVAALLFVASNLQWMPSGGESLGLSGSALIFAICVNCVLGALMTLGIGLYAPCLILISLLGMNPRAGFPIMMGSCALLMPVAGIRFVKARRYNLRASIALSVGGVPAVLIAAYIIKQLPMFWLRWLVVVVVAYAALTMLNSARRRPEPQPVALS
jgi:uncharacterized membrane protein YfcA